MRGQPNNIIVWSLDLLNRNCTKPFLNAIRTCLIIRLALVYVTDNFREAQPEWKAEARESIRKQQEMVVENLEEKVAKASETASDDFMYQDKQEAEKELDVAKKILDDIPSPLRKEELEYRTWNPLPYDRYRS